ncbi:gustatory and pheromone receptor 39a [Tribolium castaneum]|uniref:Gustatory receptor n=1 Tax=Tribolium castaneum TaxID=7070 RepID=A2AXA4_TRICA|nr:PREDICTED: gustatory and pheromone receptor 39a, isoform A [Tribolium castaneum]EFA05781.1 gustatory receptor 71 [Tribolium castaneum]CAL23175.2 gustatory receptor candidate 42 [Tribolium castaneum]|eukprot:XP_001815253.3 PREDICTED: gustatory and pheromone receptor 39a, isoform A [Tribolium castaneum]
MTDHNLLRLIVTIGEFFAMTPSRPKTRAKIYALCVVTALVTPSALSIIYYRQPIYAKISETKSIVAMVMGTIVNAFSCYTVLAPVLCKRQQYCQLMSKLLGNHQLVYNCHTFGRFLAPNLTYLLVALYSGYVWTDILGFGYFREYLAEAVQLYFQFYYTYFLCVIVCIFRGKYRNINLLLTEQLQNRRFFAKKMEGLVCSIKELNMIFNEFFGWPIIMIILYSSLMVLNYIDEVFNNNFGYDKKQYIGVVVANVGVAFMINVGTVTLILSCDAVLEEVKTTLLLAYKIRQVFPNEKKNISEFINVVLNNYPDFSAAGFFSINKTTLLQIIGNVTTFFIIIIQFNNKH